MAQGDLTLAASLFEESHKLRVAFGSKAGQALALHLRGQVARQQGELALASRLLAESLRLRQNGAKAGIPESLEGLAGLLIAEDHFAGGPERILRAVLLLAAAARARDVLGLPLPPGDRAAYERDVAAARNQLGLAAWQAAWAEGRAMTLEQAIELAFDQGR